MATVQPPPKLMRSFLIPFAGGDIVLPNSLVVEVLPFATPLMLENAPPWVVGAMLWRARTIPLASLGRLLFDKNPSTGGHARIVVVNALGNNPKLLNYGLLAIDAPRPINLQRSDIGLDEEAAKPNEWMWSRVRVKNQPAVIPNLDAIEKALALLIRA